MICSPAPAGAARASGMSAPKRAMTSTARLTDRNVVLTSLNGCPLRASGLIGLLIALPGYASAEDARRAIDAGFIAKPPDLTGLLAIIPGR